MAAGGRGNDVLATRVAVATERDGAEGRAEERIDFDVEDNNEEFDEEESTDEVDVDWLSEESAPSTARRSFRPVTEQVLSPSQRYLKKW